MKDFKFLDEQADYLNLVKNITINNKDIACDILLNSNYYNLVSCAKIKYVVGINGTNHIYNNTNFDDWVEYFNKDIKVSKYLMDPMIDFERKLNSRVTYYVSMIIEKDNNIASDIKDKLSDIIRQNNVKLLSVYSGNETWRYITKMEFGSMKRLLYLLVNNIKNINIKTYVDLILDGFNLNIKHLRRELDEINNLRNHLFHFTPLNIYINNGHTKNNNSKLSNKSRKKAINYIYNMKPNSEIEKILKEFYNNSSNYIRIKNNQN